MKNLITKFFQSISYRFDKNHWLKVAFKNGFETFDKTGVTPNEASLALINLYCISNGKFNEKIHKKIGEPVQISVASEIFNGVLGRVDLKEFHHLNSALNKEGYVFFENKIPLETVNALKDYAFNTGAYTAPSYDRQIIYNPAKPESEIYRFDIVELMNNEYVQALAADPTLVNLARNYLGCEPIFDFPAMWWSTAFLKEASSEAAQLYHFDMDRIKWLKIFIYLNDVTEDNGPHRYIRGSHVPGKKPAEILKRGYARIPDSDLHKYYKAEDFKVVYGTAGSIFAGDTKCFHKGTALKRGDRLVLELEYTSSLFGANYPKLEVTRGTKAFKEFCNANKTFARNIKIKY